MHYLINHLPTAWALTVIHLRLSLVPVLAGVAIALPWGVVAWEKEDVCIQEELLQFIPG